MLKTAQEANQQTLTPFEENVKSLVASVRRDIVKSIDESIAKGMFNTSVYLTSCVNSMVAVSTIDDIEPNSIMYCDIPYHTQYAIRNHITSDLSEAGYKFNANCWVAKGISITHISILWKLDY
jgi:hypothetical protein